MKKTSIFPVVLGAGLILGLLFSVCVLPELTSLSSYRGLKVAAGGLTSGCAAGLGCWAVNRAKSPRKRREMERAERDERSRMIRDRAAYLSWMITLAACVAAEMVLTILECTPGMIAVGLLFLVHVATYLGAAYGLNRKY